MIGHAIRLDDKVVRLALITRPCTDRTCDHPTMAKRLDTGRIITVPASLVVRA